MTPHKFVRCLLLQHLGESKYITSFVVGLNEYVDVVRHYAIRVDRKMIRFRVVSQVVDHPACFLWICKDREPSVTAERDEIPPPNFITLGGKPDVLCSNVALTCVNQTVLCTPGPSLHRARLKAAATLLLLSAERARCGREMSRWRLALLRCGGAGCIWLRGRCARRSRS
jgi:hypothetical protein